MSRNEIDILYAILREDLSSFIAKTFQVVAPGDCYLPNWHIEVIADYLMQCYLGNIKRLIITMPPRSLKSICASVAFPAWILGRNPSLRIICASYGNELSSKLARDCKAVMESDWYRKAFPATRLKRSVELDLETSRKGGRFASSVGGSLTGRGGNFIILDDLLKPQDAMSEIRRKGANEWYDSTLYSRLDNKNDDVIILVMQRLHVDDLAAHLLNKGGWVHLDLPAIAEYDQTFTLSNGQCFTRSTGDILHPERESRVVLDEIRGNLGSFNFAAQYQQQPAPVEGNLVKWAWFEFYDEAPSLAYPDFVVQSWDTASKISELSDYSVCTTWHVKGNVFYLIDVLRERLDFPALKKAVVHQALQFHPESILVEDSASGTALIQDIRYQGLQGIPNPIAVTPKGDKAMRMNTQSPRIEAGHVYLPRKADWLDDFRKEVLSFPYGAHDDQIDSMSQFLNWIDERKRNTLHVVKLQGL